MQTSSKKAAAPDYQAVRDAVADVLDVENYDDGEPLFLNKISKSFEKYWQVEILAALLTTSRGYDAASWTCLCLTCLTF